MGTRSSAVGELYLVTVDSLLVPLWSTIESRTLKIIIHINLSFKLEL
jgi:hypothetical protein